MSNEIEDLSATIIERRKRLHNLAVEINQWTEDESAKKSSQQSLNIDTTLNGSDIVGASPSFFTPGSQSRSSTVNYFSPKQYSFSACKPAAHHNYSKPLNSVNNILGAKKMNNYENNQLLVRPSVVNSKRANDDNAENQPPLKAQTSSGSLVKSIKSKFEEGGIITHNPKPKSIIQKFEQMSSSSAPPPQFSIKKNTSTTNVEHVKPVASNQQTATPPSSSAIYTDHIKPRSIIEKFEQLTKSNKKESLESIRPHNNTTGAASLTFVSSIQSLDQVGLEDEETLNEEGNQSCIEIQYDELEDVNNKNDDMFMDEEATAVEDETVDNTRGMNSIGNDAFSLSACSSYTGSMINTDFEEVDDDEGEEDDEDFENTDVTDELSQMPDETTLISCSTAEAHKAQNDETAESSTSMTSSLMSEATDVIVPIESLFSIKEYRKQKRNGGRRSSMVPKARQTQVINAQMVAKSLAKQAESSEEEQAKKARLGEKVKELEDKIKQEDAQISQFGKALEECLTNPSQTGSSQHIDCNRHLLIHCQKRQAYLTEISRLKALINPSKKTQSTTPSTNEDLTGMLIFSNIQLPVKESYMNKFKSGEDKRAFYFICLIRYGVQVLQTQVISTHELIGSRDTCIAFPNIMSIHNVDVNFRVKIDVYTMEILPRELKHHNSIKQATHNATAKFFSPFKASNLFHHHSSSSTSNSNNASNSSGSYTHYSDGHSTNGANCKTSNFIHVDTIEITFRDIDTNKFKLNISSSSIPLSGVLYVNMRCMPMKTIEQRGFMTIFEEDQNGLGTWDRRWCYLNNFNISYWKYPEDEANDKPLGSINLNRCVNESVSLLPRDLCARKFTLELNLDGELNETKTYRLSADTKDQANEWVLNVNQALANIKLWNKKPK